MAVSEICKHYTDVPIVDFMSAPEMQPYLTEPAAMYVGAPGKHGYLKLHFELDDSGKSVLRDLDRRSPLIVQQELYFDEQMPEMPCVYILSSGGQNVDGDRYRQEISVGKCAMAWISTGAATKLAEMKYNYSSMAQIITLDDNAYLEYMPEQIIPCRHTRYISDTRLIIAPTATLFYSEIFTAGRKYYGGEHFDFDILSVCTQGERLDGTKLFREKFIVEPHRHDVRVIGVMSDYDVYANAIVMTSKDNAEALYNKITPTIDASIALGITRLPNQAGLAFRVLGRDVVEVKRMVRSLCSELRQIVKYKPLPPEFPWR